MREHHLRGHQIPFTESVFTPCKRWSFLEALAKAQDGRTPEQRRLSELHAFLFRLGIGLKMLSAPSINSQSRAALREYGSRLSFLMLAMDISIFKMAPYCGMNHTSLMRVLRENRPPCTNRLPQMLAFINKRLSAILGKKIELSCEDLWPGRTPATPRGKKVYYGWNERNG